MKQNYQELLWRVGLCGVDSCLIDTAFGLGLTGHVIGVAVHAQVTASPPETTQGKFHSQGACACVCVYVCDLYDLKQSRSFVPTCESRSTHSHTWTVSWIIVTVVCVHCATFACMNLPHFDCDDNKVDAVKQNVKRMLMIVPSRSFDESPSGVTITDKHHFPLFPPAC